jgi:aspartate/methionine/tyrosine aminotransferase
LNEKPPSILEASVKVGNKEFKNILAINSISKRSSAPGLRSGYIAGDSEILKRYLQISGIVVNLHSEWRSNVTFWIF